MGETSKSKSQELAESYLNKEVEVKMDRPLGSLHPKYGFKYETNYGFIKGVTAPDGEDLDAYFLGTTSPVKLGKGRVVAVAHRLKDDDDKLVVLPDGITMTNEEIEKAIDFQERWFEHILIRKC